MTYLHIYILCKAACIIIIIYIQKSQHLVCSLFIFPIDRAFQRRWLIGSPLSLLRVFPLYTFLHCIYKQLLSLHLLFKLAQCLYSGPIIMNHIVCFFILFVLLLLFFIRPRRFSSLDNNNYCLPSAPCILSIVVVQLLLYGAQPLSPLRAEKLLFDKFR